MYEVIKAGGFTNGGLNFDAKTRRGSYTKEDLFLAFIAGMDTFAHGLRAAKALIDDGRLDQFVAKRYASWDTDLGKKISSGKVGLEELSKLALEMGEVKTNMSGSQEYLETVLNQVIFNL
jgi:xylose isomerase